MQLFVLKTSQHNKLLGLKHSLHKYVDADALNYTRSVSHVMLMSVTLEKS